MSIMSPYAMDRNKNRKKQPTMSGPPIGMSDRGSMMGQTMRQQNSPMFGGMKQSSITNKPIRKKSIFG